jgi:hypothetical protein
MNSPHQGAVVDEAYRAEDADGRHCLIALFDGSALRGRLRRRWSAWTNAGALGIAGIRAVGCVGERGPPANAVLPICCPSLINK